MFIASRLRMGAAGQHALALSLLFTLAGVRSAAADLVPSPIPECVGKPDGTFCKRGDGTAGQCKTETDQRRPGRSYQICAKDATECDRLTIGAECHGYLGKPAHCREFSDPDKKKTWRTCQVDEGSAATPTAAAPTAAAPAAPTAAPAETPPAKKGMFSCATVPGAASGTTGAGLSLLGISLLLLAARRRLRLAA